jgi:hypothetical protein
MVVVVKSATVERRRPHANYHEVAVEIGGDRGELLMERGELLLRVLQIPARRVKGLLRRDVLGREVLLTVEFAVPFFGLLCLDPWLEGLQPGKGELDRSDRPLRLPARQFPGRDDHVCSRNGSRASIGRIRRRTGQALRESLPPGLF